MKTDPLSFETVYNENFSYVYNFLYAHTLHKELSEDLTSQTFLNALSHFDSFNAEFSSVRTWLCRIAKNLLIDHYRAHPSGRSVPVDEMPEIPAEDEYEILKDPVNREVSRLLSLLTEEEKDMISLRYFMELSVSDIADMYGISLNAASKRIHRILDKCRGFEEGRSLQDFI